MGLIRKEDIHDSFWQNGVSNPNLLINGDFQVWQRGTSFAHTDQQYCADRWMMYKADLKDKVTWTKTDDGIKANCTTENANGEARLWQPMNETDRKKIQGLTLTYTVKYKTNSSKVYLMTQTGYINLQPSTSDWNTVSCTKKYTNSSQWFVGVKFGDTNYSMALNEYVEVAYIKVEVGENATPFVAKPYMNELEDCQKYFVPMNWDHHTWHHGFGQNSWLFVPLPNKMRIAPTLWGGASVPANWSLCCDGSPITPTDLRVRSLGGNGVLLNFTGSFKNNYALIGYYNSGTLGGFDAEIY